MFFFLLNILLLIQKFLPIACGIFDEYKGYINAKKDIDVVEFESIEYNEPKISIKILNAISFYQVGKIHDIGLKSHE